MYLVYIGSNKYRSLFKNIPYKNNYRNRHFLHQKVRFFSNFFNDIGKKPNERNYFY